MKDLRADVGLLGLCGVVRRLCKCGPLVVQKEAISVREITKSTPVPRLFLLISHYLSVPGRLISTTDSSADLIKWAVQEEPQRRLSPPIVPT